MSNSWSWKPFETSSEETNMDIEFLKSEVGKHFPFYDFKFDANTVAFYCRIDDEFLEEKFNSLRKKLKEKEYIPMLRFEKGEHIIYIIKKPMRRVKPIWINIFLLIA